MSKLKLFKFRSLGSCEDFERVSEIIETEKFWCSKLWELNDPMEGVYSHSSGEFSPDEIQAIFSSKNDYVICSLSGKRAFNNPSIWGYYANGFKGVAIEITDLDLNTHEVTYAKNVTEMKSKFDADGNQLKAVMTTKLDHWKREYEYRYLAREQPASYRFGKIALIHIGFPFFTVNNLDSVLAASECLCRYYQRASCIVKIARNKGIECKAARICQRNVKSEELDLVELERMAKL